MQTLLLLTGTSRGLGLKIKQLFMEKMYTVVSINRTACDVDDIILDLGKQNIDFNIFNNRILVYDRIIFINNASTIRPIEKIGIITSSDVWTATNINWCNPVLLINEIVKSGKEFYIINITSGAAFTANQKLSLYSSTKAALYRFIEILAKEQTANEKCLGVYNFDPGRMQTEMQHYLLEELHGVCDYQFYTSLPTAEDVAKKLYKKICADLV